jgi:hypothetical protein
MKFDPVKHIEGSSIILNNDGMWPNFHDADIYSLNFWRGDMRPDDDVWIGPVINASLELSALENPFVVDMRFHDCDYIQIESLNHQNMIYMLSFSFEERGTYTDGSPLPPYISVEFEQTFGVSLKFKCFRAEVIGRREVPDLPQF